MQEEQKSKKSFKDRFVEAAPYLIGGTIYCATIVIIVAYSFKHVKEGRERIESAIARGAEILENPDGSYWVVESDGRKSLRYS